MRSRLEQAVAAAAWLRHPRSSSQCGAEHDSRLRQRHGYDMAAAAIDDGLKYPPVCTISNIMSFSIFCRKTRLKCPSIAAFEGHR